MYRLGLSNQTNSPQTNISGALKIGFWKRQFQLQLTKKQKIFDWFFGIILPTACCLFDPLVFKGAISHNGAILGEYKPFAYLISFVSIVLMMLFLLFEQKLKWFNGILAGLFLVGSAISLLVGIIIFPLSLFGLIFLIGILGFTPLFASFVYFRNSIRAISFSEITINNFLLFNLVAVSAIFSFVLPYLFYLNIETSLREMENGNAVLIRKHTEKLQPFSAFTNIDRLGLKSCGESDESKKELRVAIQKLSGMNDDEINRQYCYDW